MPGKHGISRLDFFVRFLPAKYAKINCHEQMTLVPWLSSSDIELKTNWPKAFTTDKRDGPNAGIPQPRKGGRDGQRSRRCGSKCPEVEFVAGDTKVFDNVRNDTARNIAGMPRKGDQAVWTKWIGVVPVTARSAKEFTTDFAESPLQLAAVPGGIFAHESRGKNEPVAERGRDGASGFQQRFQVGFGGLLKAKRGLATVASVRVAAGQQAGPGNPHSVFIPAKSHFREWNNHGAAILTGPASGVKRAFVAWRFQT